MDYLVVGAGLTGGTIARRLADAGREVLILERRPHLGGNVHDFVHPSGIRVHTYGPHYFRCSSPRVWQFVNRFGEFYPYEAQVKSWVHGRYRDWPLHRNQVNGCNHGRAGPRASRVRNFEEACLRKMPRELYDSFVRNYTRRQWGADPTCLDAQLARRVRVNPRSGQSLTPHFRFQGLPRHGYAAWTGRLLSGIPSVLGVDFLRERDAYRARKRLVFTGPLDEFFGFDAGRLAYRGQRRIHDYRADTIQLQPCAQINYPEADDDGPIRTVEWRHLMPTDQQRHLPGTVVTSEFPFSPVDADAFEYPFPDAENRRLHQHYLRRASRLCGLLVCGRLGEYRYCDMDQAIARALVLADRMLAGNGAPR